MAESSMDRTDDERGVAGLSGDEAMSADPAQAVDASPGPKQVASNPSPRARPAAPLKAAAPGRTGGANPVAAKASQPKPRAARPSAPGVAGSSPGSTRKAAKAGAAPIPAAPRKMGATGPAKRALAAPRAGTAYHVPTSTLRTKEPTMSNPTPDYTETMHDTVADMQNRSKAAYEKSSEMMTEMSDSAKGTLEAMVESGKIFSTGMQELARNYVEEAKTAYEQITADLKEMAAVKSPTELLQLQGKIVRRNFDAVVSTTSKSAEKMMKLSNDAFAPISARLSVAADKMSKVD